MIYENVSKNDYLREINVNNENLNCSVDFLLFVGPMRVT